MLSGGNLVIVFLKRINRIHVSPEPEQFVLGSNQIIPQKKVTPRWEQTPGIVLENPLLLHLSGLVIPCEVYSLSFDLSVNHCSWKNFQLESTSTSLENKTP